MNTQILESIGLAFALMLAGYGLSACFYYMLNNNWNGYKLKSKQIVATIIMFTVAALLVTIPEMAETIKAMSGLDMNVDTSKPGFFSFGVALAVMVRTKLKS